MESIKIGTKKYELVSNGFGLTAKGGKAIFLPGTDSFDAVEATVKTANGVELLDETDSQLASVTGIVYAGMLTKDDNYLIRVEPEGKEVYGTVMIATFREPDLREKINEVQAQVDYVAMMANIQIGV